MKEFSENLMSPLRNRPNLPAPSAHAPYPMGKVGIVQRFKLDFYKPSIQNAESMVCKSPVDPYPFELVAKLRIVVPDEEKSAAGLFFDRRLGSKNKPRADFDEVWRGEAHWSNMLLFLIPLSPERGRGSG